MPPHESLTVTNGDDIYIPGVGLLRSGVYLEGTASVTVEQDTLPEPDSFNSLVDAVGDIDETAVPGLYEPLRDAVAVTETEAGTAADLTAGGGVLRGTNREFPSSIRFTDIEKEEDDVRVTASWRGELIVIHPALWSGSDIVNRAVDAVSGYDAITQREYQTSEVGVGFPPPGWREVTPPEDNRHDDIEAAWMHESLLYLVAVGYAENETSTMWTVTEVGAAVPNPHPDLVVTGYAQRGAAHSDAERLMLSISGALETASQDDIDHSPVTAARGNFSYRGARARLDDPVVTDPAFTDTAELFDSLPAEPLTRTTFIEDVLPAMRQNHGEDAVILLPDEAVIHDASISTAIDNADATLDDLVTAFTVVEPGTETITVYGLEESSMGGVAWYKHTGTFAAFTPGDDHASV
ncbi:hypothetical protein [Salinibaculum rarum]|uniref:hypothetical protein n=1 Tax=Salinibaculum rarum TaxID=3058903 RepID=UPI0026601F71|nr:hypothetical protein [Salinibaculum sp. KK48]